MADVARGLWKPPTIVEAPVEIEVPTFHEFAEDWWVRNQAQLAENTRADYRWRLECHLLPEFGERRIDRIDFNAVERYIAGKLAGDRPLSARSINMTVTLLGAILERASETQADRPQPRQGQRPPRQGARARAVVPGAPLGRSRRYWTRPASWTAGAASNRRHIKRRAMLAVLVFAGLRINELCALRWRDVDLAARMAAHGLQDRRGPRPGREDPRRAQGRAADAPRGAADRSTRTPTCSPPAAAGA